MDLGYFETSLPVADIGKSMAFYEVLGFARAEYAEDAGNATMIRGDCRLGLFQGHLAPDRAQLIFWQGPVEDVAAAAERSGLTFLKPLHHDAEGGCAFMLQDPDDHPLYFIRMKTFYPQYPAHTTPAPAERPPAPEFDPAFGWYMASLPVKDVDRSVAFYEALGFVVVGREADDRHVTLQNADCRIGLFQGHLQPPQLQLIFWQGEVMEIAEAVRRAGLDFYAAPRGDPEHGSFMLRDPDGHPLYFVRMPGVVRPTV
jgi:lactoylglutathione lyase